MGTIEDGDGLEPEESLELIRESIRGARRVHAADGRYLVAWGLAVLAASVASLSLAASGIRGPVYAVPWALAYAAGFIASYRISRSGEGASRASSPASRAVAALWTGFVVAAAALAVPRIFGAMDDAAYVAALCALLGLVNWGSASALRAPWFRAVAALWWLGALSIPFLGRAAALIAATVLVLLGQVLPGAVLLVRDLRGRAHA